MSAADQDDLVVIGECGSDLEAQQIKGILTENGIHCFIQGERHHSLMGMLGGFIQMKIMVPASQSAAADEIIAAFRAAPLAEFVGEDVSIAEPGFSESTPPARQRKRAATAAIAALALTFGMGHCYAGAYRRFFFLAVVQAVLFAMIVSGRGTTLHIVLLALLPVTDLIGAIVTIRKNNRLSDSSSKS